MKDYYLLLMTGSKETQCYSGKDSHGAEKEEEDLVISRGLVYDVCWMMIHYHYRVSRRILEYLTIHFKKFPFCSCGHIYSFIQSIF